MKKLSWQFWLAMFLIVLSILLYSLHYVIFLDPHHIFIYMLGDLAFLPIEVLLVTVIVHRLLSQREKRAMLEKLNMVIESFFSEVGTGLLRYFIKYDPEIDKIRKQLMVNAAWSDSDFMAAKAAIRQTDHGILCPKMKLRGIKEYLEERRDFLLRLLENPNLLEHESFTDTLWAVFHLIEELLQREDLEAVCDKDLDHLRGDMNRAYSTLTSQWLDYMMHLKNSYPYLFSLAARMNPFDPEASPEITK